MSGVLTFEEGPHEYKLDGEVIPSVSQMCTEAGLWDKFNNSGFAKKLDPSIRGTRIHYATELLDKGLLDQSQIEGTAYQPYLEAWGNAVSDSGVKIKEVEIRHHMTLDGLTFAGTIDRVVERSTGEIEVWDLKTGSDHGEPYAVQLAAYRFLIEDYLGYEVAATCCVFINAKGKYRINDKSGERWDRKWREICQRFAQEK